MFPAFCQVEHGGNGYAGHVTHPFITYFPPLYLRTLVTGLLPRHIAADAAFDARSRLPGGGPSRGPGCQPPQPAWSFRLPPSARRRASISASGLRMHPTCQFSHAYGYLSQRFRCPLLFASADRPDLRPCPVPQSQRLCQGSQLGTGRADARHAGSWWSPVQGHLLPAHLV